MGSAQEGVGSNSRATVALAAATAVAAFPVTTVGAQDWRGNLDDLERDVLEWVTGARPLGEIPCSGRCDGPGKGLVFASFHKAGVYASGQLSTLFNASHDFYYRGCKKPYATPVVVFTRNPFALIVSSYKYHKRCSEAFYARILEKRHTRGHNVVEAVVMARKRFGVTDARWDRESYCGYLQRLPEQSALLVEMVRVMWFPMRHMLRALRCDQGEPVLRLCLEDLMADPQGQIARISKIRNVGPSVVDAYRALSSSKVSQSHKTGSAKNDELNDLARALDQRLFDSMFARFEALETCAPSRTPAPASAG